MITVGGISMVTSFFSGIYLLLEGPSYATYIKKKTEYFNRLEYAIKNTSSYYEFLRSFYDAKHSYEQWGNFERIKAEKLAKMSSDKILTDTFHFIDKYGWLILLIIMGVFMLFALSIKK